MLYAFFWVIPRHLNLICQWFGTLCLFHLHRWVSMKNDGFRMLGYLYGKRLTQTCRIPFTYVPVGSMWVVALHSLFLYSDPPLPCHPPSDWLRLSLRQTFSRINNPAFSAPIILHTY